MKDFVEIIYCYRNREPERVQATLTSLANQTDKRFKVTFIDYGSDEIFSNPANEICSKYEFCTYFYVNSRGKMWNRGDALNHGILLSKGDSLFFADIDMIFLSGFVEHLQILKDEGSVHFFPVGYLNRSASLKAKKGKTKALSYKKSEDFATGMLLAPRSVLNTVNGYNTFYCLWGLEDNDLKRRIELSGFKTKYVAQVWMLHMYHQPVPGTKNLPDGWIQMMKDYFNANSKVKTNTSGITQSLTLGGRPAETQFNSGKLQFKELSGRKLFLRYTLFTMISANNSGAFSIKPMLPEKTGFVQRYGLAMSKVLRWFNIHALIVSPYKEQYISKEEILGEIYFVIKMLNSRLVDYYVHSTTDTIRLVVITR